MSAILLIERDAAGRQQLTNLLGHLGQIVAIPSISEAMLTATGASILVVILAVDFSQSHPEVAIQDVRARYAQLPLLVIADNPNVQGLEAALRAGIAGCLLRGDPLEEWTQAMAAVGRKELYVSNALAPSLLQHVLHSLPASQAGGLQSLTDRELGIFEMLGAGMRPPEIAQRLQLSCKTIESHREKIKHRLGFNDSAALVHFACMWVQHQATGAPLPEHLLNDHFSDRSEAAAQQSVDAP